MDFTLGFVFTADTRRVLLIRKQRPAWQAGKINGVGGKLEPGESPVDGVRREVYEETGLDVPNEQWIATATMQAEDWRVYVFSATLTTDPAAVESRTDEPVAWYPLDALPDGMIGNLTWLIPLCLDRLTNGAPQHVQARY